MQFNGDPNKFDIVSDIDYWAGTNSTTYPIEDKVRAANLAKDRVEALILRSDTNWQWDDANSTDLPIGITDLVANHEDISIPIADLKVVRVRVKDRNGNYITLDPVSRRSLSDAQLRETGTPRSYEKIGSSFFLTPTPDYSVDDDGFEVQYQRSGSYFTKDDTAKEPGFPSLFHRLISLYSALDYTEANGRDARSAVIRNRIGRPPTEGDPGVGMEKELVEFFTDRDRDQKPEMRVERTIEVF